MTDLVQYLVNNFYFKFYSKKYFAKKVQIFSNHFRTFNI